MAPKKSGLKNLSKKGLKKADSVKGGRKKEITDAKTGRMAANHNFVSWGRISLNHNLVVL